MVCSCRKPRFCSQNPHGGSGLSITPLFTSSSAPGSGGVKLSKAKGTRSESGQSWACATCTEPETGGHGERHSGLGFFSLKATLSKKHTSFVFNCLTLTPEHRVDGRLPLNPVWMNISLPAQQHVLRDDAYISWEACCFATTHGVLFPPSAPPHILTHPLHS